MNLFDVTSWNMEAIETVMKVIGIIAGLLLVARALVALTNQNFGRTLKLGGLGFILWGAVSVIEYITEWATYYRTLAYPFTAPQTVNGPSRGPWADMPTIVVMAFALIGIVLLVIGVLVDLPVLFENQQIISKIRSMRDRSTMKDSVSAKTPPSDVHDALRLSDPDWYRQTYDV